MNPSSIISADDPILGDLDSVRRNWRWILASGFAFVVLGAMALGYSVLVTLASVFVLGWALVFGGIFQADGKPKHARLGLGLRSHRAVGQPGGVLDQRVGTTQPVLDTDAVRAGLADLDHSMGELEGALSLCGIKQP